MRYTKPKVKVTVFDKRIYTTGMLPASTELDEDLNKPGTGVGGDLVEESDPV